MKSKHIITIDTRKWITKKAYADKHNINLTTVSMRIYRKTLKVLRYPQIGLELVENV